MYENNYYNQLPVIYTGGETNKNKSGIKKE